MSNLKKQNTLKGKLQVLDSKSLGRKDLRILLGYLVYRSGLFRAVVRSTHARDAGLIKRIQSYLHHYLDQASACPASMRIGPTRIKLRCDINDHMLKPHLFEGKQLYEIAEIVYCSMFVAPNDVLIDIGANHGFWGFILASHEPEISKLIAVEANPELAQRIRYSQKLNPGIPMEVIEKAITKGGVENVTFYLPMPNSVGNLSGLGSIILHRTAKENGYLSSERKISCRATSLDALVEHLGLHRVDIIKIDVEQAEDFVIEGAERVIQRFKPKLIMMETSIGSDASCRLLRAGYKAHILTSGNQSTREIPDDFWGNIFYTIDA